MVSPIFVCAPATHLLATFVLGLELKM